LFRWTGWVARLVILAIWLPGGASPALAQNQEEPEVGWSNRANLSLVVTNGNSVARTLGFDDWLPVTLIKPEAKPDVANYMVSGRYRRSIRGAFFWNAGATETTTPAS
jgi:hypothetical protein